MAHGDNPAARLRWFMERLRPHIGTPAATSQAAPTCCGVFGLKWPDDTGQLLSRLAEVAALARQTRVITDALPPELEAREMLGPFNQVEQVVVNMGAVGYMTTYQLMHPMTDAGWQSLRTADILLRQHAREPVLDDDAVKMLIDQTRDLADAIRDIEDLPPDVRRWMLDRLGEIERVLADVDLYGFPHAEAAVERLIGGLARSEERARGVVRSRIWSHVKTYFVATDLALNLAANAVTLAGLMPARAPSPSPVIEIIEQRAEVTPALSPAERDRGRTGDITGR